MHDHEVNFTVIRAQDCRSSQNSSEPRPFGSLSYKRGLQLGWNESREEFNSSIFTLSLPPKSTLFEEKGSNMTAVIQRPIRGSRISAFYPVKNLPSLASLDSAFQLQEYISLLIRLDVHDVNSIVSLPGNVSAKDKEKEVEVSSEKKEKEGEKDVLDKGKAESSQPTVDEACWIYEQLRSVSCIFFRFFFLGPCMNLSLGALHRTFHTH